MSTPWGGYYASVFKQVRGKRMTELALTDKLVYTVGKSLGRLHQLSSEYLHPRVKRWTYNDVFDWIDNTLKEGSSGNRALKESRLLRKYFSTLPVDKENFGLIHYDFELDNVFYDKAARACSVIDFDDAMYHWYAMDIEQSLDSLKEETPENKHREKQDVFIQGYRSEFPVPDVLLEMLPVFRRFANLYGYARIARSTRERWENEPEWMSALRIKLGKASRNRAASFGKEIGQRAKSIPATT